MGMCAALKQIKNNENAIRTNPCNWRLWLKTQVYSNIWSCGNEILYDESIQLYCFSFYEMGLTDKCVLSLGFVANTDRQSLPTDIIFSQYLHFT